MTGSLRRQRWAGRLMAAGVAVGLLGWGADIRQLTRGGAFVFVLGILFLAIDGLRTGVVLSDAGAYSRSRAPIRFWLVTLTFLTFALLLLWDGLSRLVMRP